METTASNHAPTLLESSRCCPPVECLELGSLGAVYCKAFLVSQPGAWIPAVKSRQNQAINEMYCFGPPCPALGEGKKTKQNCTVSRIKHTHLALNVEVGPSILGQD